MAVLCESLVRCLEDAYKADAAAHHKWADLATELFNTEGGEGFPRAKYTRFDNALLLKIFDMCEHDWPKPDKLTKAKRVARNMKISSFAATRRIRIWKKIGKLCAARGLPCEVQKRRAAGPKVAGVLPRAARVVAAAINAAGGDPAVTEPDTDAGNATAAAGLDGPEAVGGVAGVTPAGVEPKPEPAGDDSTEAGVDAAGVRPEAAWAAQQRGERATRRAAAQTQAQWESWDERSAREDSPPAEAVATTAAPTLISSDVAPSVAARAASKAAGVVAAVRLEGASTRQRRQPAQQAATQAQGSRGSLSKEATPEGSPPAVALAAATTAAPAPKPAPMDVAREGDNDEVQFITVVDLTHVRRVTAGPDSPDAILIQVPSMVEEPGWTIYLCRVKKETGRVGSACTPSRRQPLPNADADIEATHNRASPSSMENDDDARSELSVSSPRMQQYDPARDDDLPLYHPLSQEMMNTIAEELRTGAGDTLSPKKARKAPGSKRSREEGGMVRCTSERRRRITTASQ
jgi:hypothetical protein